MTLALATVVTILLKACYRVFSVREYRFRIVTERIFNEVLAPRIAHLLDSVTVEQARNGFLDGVTPSDGYEQRPGGLRPLLYDLGASGPKTNGVDGLWEFVQRRHLVKPPV